MLTTARIAKGVQPGEKKGVSKQMGEGGGSGKLQHLRYVRNVFKTLSARKQWRVLARCRLSCVATSQLEYFAGFFPLSFPSLPLPCLLPLPPAYIDICGTLKLKLKLTLSLQSRLMPLPLPTISLQPQQCLKACSIKQSHAHTHTHAQQQAEA